MKTYLIRRIDDRVRSYDACAYVVRADNEGEAYALCEDDDLTKDNSIIKDLDTVKEKGVVIYVLGGE